MKKLIILLVCGFAFTQSIQTKQVEVTINDWSDYEWWSGLGFNAEGVKIDISSLIGLYNNQEYLYKIIKFTQTDGLNFQNPYRYSFYQDSNLGNSMGQYIELDSNELSINRVEEIRFNTEYPFLYIGTDSGLVGVTGTFTFWVTGMFEDEGVGLQGDMNDDDIINVIDVISLVNIIVGEG